MVKRATITIAVDVHDFEPEFLQDRVEALMLQNLGLPHPDDTRTIGDGMRIAVLVTSIDWKE